MYAPNIVREAPVVWEAPSQVVWEAPREVIIEAPRIISPLGYDNYGNSNVEHPYAYLNNGNGTTYAVESEVTHRAPQGYAPYNPVFAPQYVRAYP